MITFKPTKMGAVLMEHHVKGEGAQAPGRFVLQDRGGGRYVVHFQNFQDVVKDMGGGLHSGNYCDDLADAVEHFTHRIKGDGEPAHRKVHDLGFGWLAHFGRAWGADTGDVEVVTLIHLETAQVVTAPRLSFEALMMAMPSK